MMMKTTTNTSNRMGGGIHADENDQDDHGIGSSSGAPRSDSNTDRKPSRRTSSAYARAPHPIRRRAPGSNNGGGAYISHELSSSDEHNNKKWKSRPNSADGSSLSSSSIKSIVIMALCLLCFLFFWDKRSSDDLRNHVNFDTQPRPPSSSPPPPPQQQQHRSHRQGQRFSFNSSKSPSQSEDQMQQQHQHQRTIANRSVFDSNVEEDNLKHYDADEVLEEGTGHDQCGVWMAPSGLRPYPGYGIFTTRNIRYDDYILHGPDAVTIPIHDMRTVRKGDHKLPFHEERRRIWRNVFSNYVWARGATDHALYDNPPDSVDFQPGFGSLPNHHCILHSLGSSSENNPYRDNILGNRTSPGLGASTYNIGRAFYAVRNLKAGEEIFLNYGHCSRDDNSPKWAGNSIFPDDILEAVRIVKLFQPFGSKEWPVNGSITGLEDLVDPSSGAIARFVVAILSRLSTKESRHKLYDTYQAIIDENNPKRKSRNKIVQSMAKARNADTRKNLAEKSLRFEVAKLSLVKPKREVSWIENNGMCLEHLIPKKSLLPDAGFGGFSQYGIEKGKIVVPVPVLHVTQKEVLELYDLDIDGSLEQKGTSLLVNYCFGHSHSSMLLCPMTGALLINHCSTRTKDCGPHGPNAAVRWSSGWDPDSHEYRNKTLADIDDKVGRILSLEIFATRDILPGEEVYIDYGEEWEKAWTEHVVGWQPPPKLEGFISAEEMNARKGPIPNELMSDDLRQRVKHPYLFAGCQYFVTDDVDNSRNYSEPNKEWMNLSDREILETYSTSGERFAYDFGTYSRHKDRSHWPCSVIRAESQNGRYTVRIHASPLISKVPTWKKYKVPRILTGYRQDAIHWFVSPQAADQRLRKAFRHHMGFSEWPQQWKNANVLRSNHHLGKDLNEE